MTDRALEAHIERLTGELAAERDPALKDAIFEELSRAQFTKKDLERLERTETESTRKKIGAALGAKTTVYPDGTHVIEPDPEDDDPDDDSDDDDPDEDERKGRTASPAPTAAAPDPFGVRALTKHLLEPAAAIPSPWATKGQRAEHEERAALVAKCRPEFREMAAAMPMLALKAATHMFQRSA